MVTAEADNDSWLVARHSGYDTVLTKMTGTPGPGVRHISGLRVLNNHAVNFVSALLTAALAGLLGFVGGTPGVAA